MASLISGPVVLLQEQLEDLVRRLEADEASSAPKSGSPSVAAAAAAADALPPVAPPPGVSDAAAGRRGKGHRRRSSQGKERERRRSAGVVDTAPSPSSAAPDSDTNRMGTTGSSSSVSPQRPTSYAFDAGVLVPALAQGAEGGVMDAGTTSALAQAEIEHMRSELQKQIQHLEGLQQLQALHLVRPSVTLVAHSNYVCVAEANLRLGSWLQRGACRGHIPNQRRHRRYDPIACIAVFSLCAFVQPCIKLWRRWLPSRTAWASCCPIFRQAPSLGAYRVRLKTM